MTNVKKIIDFHAHVFNPKIAHLAIENLEKHYHMPWDCKGTLDDMKANMESSHFYRAVLFSTPTKPSQVIVNNDFLMSIDDERFIVFGSVHPDYEDVSGEVRRIKDFGLKGFKFHPDFQRFNIDDDKALKMYEAIGENYPIVLHVGDETLDFSAPRRLARVLEIFPELTFIAAHMGGYSKWDSDAKYLLGKNLYVDTSSTMQTVPPEKMVEMIHTHGADKVLFGTDYPAVHLAEEAEKLLSLALTDEEKEKIMYKNAERLLSL